MSWWADRGCQFAGVDPLYHTTLWVHERLGWFVGALAALSSAVVLTKVVVARLRFMKLQAVAEAAPARVQHAIERVSSALAVRRPTMLYVDLTAPIATTVVGRTVIVSRGFLERLDDEELELVVRHELAHVRRGDAAAGVLWHLVFAAMLIPGFEALERRFHARRERLAHLTAAEGKEESYLALMSRIARGGDLCVGARLGLEAAGRRAEDRWLVWVAPVAVACLAIALPLSHLEFRHDLPYLLAHHC